MDSSDSRFKRDVTPVVGALDKVLSLQGRNYDFDHTAYPDRSFPKTRQLGWIADDLEGTLPELVSKDSEGFRQVAYGHASVLVAEAVKELTLEYRQEIASLKARIDELENASIVSHKT
jgi:hypothetical protein